MALDRKTVIITGASQGIGAALVKAYRDRDYRVVAVARSIKPCTDPDVLAIAGDIAHYKTAERAVQEGLKRFGRIDSLVNNAGIFIAKPFTQYTDEDLAKYLNVNVSGFFYITQLAIAEMEKQKSGHVVQITTTLAERAISGVPSVLASLTKGGLNAATRSLAIEYAKSGIRVNAVSPGIIKTPMHAPETYQALSALHPVGRMGEMPTSSRRCSISKMPASSPVRSCMSMAARARGTEMPIVTIQVTREGVTAAEKSALIEGASRLLLEILGKPLDSTFVVIEEVELENWGWGGLPVQEYRRRLRDAKGEET